MPSKMMRLQEELQSIYEQLKDAVAQNEQMKSSNESYIHHLQAKIKEQQGELNILKGKLQSHDPKKIQTAVLEEATKHYELKMKELHSEVDKLREQYNNLHFENAVLKCQFKSHESEYSRNLERMKLQHLAEVEQLQNKVETLEKEKSQPSDTYAMELKSAKRDLLQLTSKVKVLQAECEELRAQNENQSLQMNSLNRTHSKQLADHMNNIRALESEKSKLIMQKEVLEKELANCQEHRKTLNNELQVCRREIFSLRSKAEECEHKCRMVTTNLQVEMEQWKAEKESEQERLHDEIARLKAELQALKDSLVLEQQTVITKEQDYQQNLITARQQFWKQINELNQEKDKLERKIKEIESNRDQAVSQLNHELQIMQQKLQQSFTLKTDLEKELVAMKDELDKTLKSSAVAADENLSKESCLNYRKEIQELKERIDVLTARGSDISLEKEKILRETIAASIPQHVHGNENEILQLKLSWEQQKLQFHQRLEELESQLKETKNSYAAEKRELEFKMKQYSTFISKLRKKLEDQKTRNEELELQNEELEKNVPLDAHIQVKNRLKELQKRLEEYRRVIATGPSISLSDKLLTEIQNIPLLTFPFEDSMEKHGLLKPENGSSAEKLPKKPHRPRRRFQKNRVKGQQMSKITSPVVTSSSDLELENL
ncbi:girdin-like isoform X2 [Stegodyphus dumicola]|uniref:girdin-like isoform X2 n=1 Tax=Stegodyphus dumicola TaxID=202533 RepID=UPI0015AFA971|nr:girdin-like isoform X2 [Stegodyphus dumicola]